MAKNRVSEKDRLEWQAEDLARTAYEKSPEYKKAVRVAKTQLKQAAKQVAKQIKGKK